MMEEFKPLPGVEYHFRTTWDYNFWDVCFGYRFVGIISCPRVCNEYVFFKEGQEYKYNDFSDAITALYALWFAQKL